MFISRKPVGAYSFFNTAPSVSCTMQRMENQKDIENKRAASASRPTNGSGVGAAPSQNAAATSVALDADDIANAVLEATQRRKAKSLRSCDFDEERRRDLHHSFNHRISYLCKMAALIIAVVTFGSTVLGQDNARFVVLGLSLSVALLAIALLQDSSQHKR